MGQLARSQNPRRSRHANVSVRAPVVEQIPFALAHHPFHENDIRNLAHFLPWFLRSENPILRARDHDARVVSVEHRYAGTVHELVVRTVENKNNSFRRHDGRRPGFSHARIKLPRAYRQHWPISRVRPVQQISRRCQPHLVVVVRSCSEIIHPVLAGNFFRHDRPRLRPAHVPPSLVSRKNHASPFPVDQILRSRQTQLRILLVVAGVSQIIGVSEPNQPRVFHSSIFFVILFRRKYWLPPPREGDTTPTPP